MVVLVDSLADKQDLPRFMPPKVKVLRPSCLVLIDDVYKGAIMSRSLDAISLGFLVVNTSVPQVGGPPSPYVVGLGLGNPLPTRITI